nr:unnamed protein product [Callosobruchus analis]
MGTRSVANGMEQWNYNKIPKKGVRTDCCNWRGVCKSTEKVREQLRNEQAGIRKGKSCIDQIAIAKIIIEQTLEMNSKLIMVFIDFEKAFDSV